MKLQKTPDFSTGINTRMLYHNFSLNGPMESNAAPLIVNSAGCQVNPPVFHTFMKVGRVDFYLLYMLEGTMPFFCDGKEFSPLCAGSFMIIPPHCPYEYYSKPEDPVKYFFVHFTGFYAQEYLKMYGFRQLPFRHDAPLNTDIITRFQNLLSSFIPQKSFLNAELASRTDSLLRALARLLLNEKSPEKISRSLNYINRHYSQNIRISDLAGLEFLSISRYMAIFREIMGVSPAQYIIRVRLETACVLLCESNYSIKEIGNMVGYSEPHYFYNLFKHHIGVSPGEYRK